MKRQCEFCTECRMETEYRLEPKVIRKVIKDKDYEFTITAAICSECGSEVDVRGLIDKNSKEVDHQYRVAAGIISIEDISLLLKLYNIGKTPLSIALGFGEVTVQRYLDGQIPSKEYSDIMANALASPTFFKNKLRENKEKITPAAYKKAWEAADKLERAFTVSSKLLRVITYIFEKLDEVTPLSLQKLLYFTQGFFLALYGKAFFEEDCEAWVHGPVYAPIYRLFKDFTYNPIDDVRFSILFASKEVLTEEEKEVLDVITQTFGIYEAKVLEYITHNEDPWKQARIGYTTDEYSHEILTKESIQSYYQEVSKKYNLKSVEDVKQYIQDVIG